MDPELAALTASAVRVPSVLPGKWVYLRSWSDSHRGLKERTWGSRVLVCAAAPDWAECRAEGLPHFRCNAGSTEANANALDGWLKDLGAEPVLSGEWPDGCVGDGFRPDRPPFLGSYDDTDIQDWYAWLENNEPKRGL